MREPLTDFHHNGILLVSLYKWPTKSDGTIYHTGMIFEIKHKNKTKHIYVHKSIKIKITDEYSIHREHDLIPIKISKNKIQTIKEIMDIALAKLGTHNFFNWSPINNCQVFTRIMIIAMGKKKKYIKQQFNYDFSYIPNHFMIILLYIGYIGGNYLVPY
jgi:hypothetical protein